MLIWGVRELEDFVAAVVCSPGSVDPGVIADYMEERPWMIEAYSELLKSPTDELLAILRMPGGWRLSPSGPQPFNPGPTRTGRQAVYLMGQQLIWHGRSGSVGGQVWLATVPTLNCQRASCGLSAIAVVDLPTGAAWACDRCRDALASGTTGRADPILWSYDPDSASYYVGESRWVTRDWMGYHGLRIGDISSLGLTGTQLIRHLELVFSGRRQR